MSHFKKNKHFNTCSMLAKLTNFVQYWQSVFLPISKSDRRSVRQINSRKINLLKSLNQRELKLQQQPSLIWSLMPNLYPESICMADFLSDLLMAKKATVVPLIFSVRCISHNIVKGHTFLLLRIFIRILKMFKSFENCNLAIFRKKIPPLKLVKIIQLKINLPWNPGPLV